MRLNLPTLAEIEQERAGRAHRKTWRVLPDRACQACGKTFNRGRTGAVAFLRKQFCSRACHLAAFKATAAAVRRSSVKPCIKCGKALPSLKPNQTAKRKYCSTKCAYAHRLDKRRACPVCGKPCRSLIQTCSKACGYQFRKLKTRTQKPCKHCGKSFWPGIGGKVFCSRDCYFAYKHAQVELACHGCRKAFKRYRSAIDVRGKVNNFCSTKCASLFRSGENSPMWRGGTIHYRGSQWRQIANAIRDRDQHTCQRCGRVRVEGQKPFPVDHIRPWRMFEDKAAANHPDNLTTLCGPCHAFKTNTCERAMLRGDVLAQARWEQALKRQPWTSECPR